MGNGTKMPNAGAIRSRRQKVTMVNASGGALAPGTWVKLKLDALGERAGKLFVEKAVSGMAAVGIVDPDSHSSNIGDSAPVTVVVHGPTLAMCVNSSSAIVLADRLICSGTAGVAMPSASPGAGLVVGLAREAQNIAVAGLVKVYLMNPMGILSA